MSDQTTETVELPAALVSRIEERVAHTEFDETADYISYVMDEVLYTVDAEHELPAGAGVDEQQVADRLESLGYLNE